MPLIGNMLYLWIFGNNVEDALGPVRFTFFYLVCALLALVAHAAPNAASPVPLIGASGAVSGVRPKAAAPSPRSGRNGVEDPRSRGLTVRGRVTRWPRQPKGVNVTFPSDERALEGVLSATVPGPAVAFTASLSGVPAEHDGGTPFKLTLTFSEDVPMSYVTVRDRLFTVSGATIPNVRRLNALSNLHYEVTVRPSGNDQVSLERAELPACGESGSICTPGGRAVEGAISATVPRPPGLSVADVRVDEGPNVTADFAVTLSRAATETVTVSYETSDGTATQGEDYQAASGTLTFAPGETNKTVSVNVLDDSHEEGEETLTLTLSNPSGGNVFLADATAQGTIVNTDPMPRAWLVRFGRTVASHVVEGLSRRLGDGARPHVTVAGFGLGPGSVGEAEDPFAREGWASLDAREPETHSPSAAELLLGSSFHLSSEEANGGGAAFTGLRSLGPVRDRWVRSRGRRRLDGRRRDHGPGRVRRRVGAGARRGDFLAKLGRRLLPPGPRAR